LVGRSEECDYPADVQSLPIVMRARTWDAERPSAEIDRRVQATRGQNESLYELDIPLLRSLRPDVLLTQDLCGVCSVTDAEVAAACEIAGVSPRIVSLSPRNLEEVWGSIETVGEALGAGERAREFTEALRQRARPVASELSGPSVAVIEWLDPPILAGLWAPDMVVAAGGTPLHGPSGSTGDRTSWSAIRDRRPDLVVVSPCSFSVPRTQRELLDPAIADGLASLRPARGIFVADEAYFSRPGPRLADGVELVRHLLRRESWTPPMTVEPWSAGTVTA
jgi:iron complex transport system substrate-binding protein